MGEAYPGMGEAYPEEPRFHPPDDLPHLGYCAATEDGEGDCAAGAKASWKLSENQRESQREARLVRGPPP